VHFGQSVFLFASALVAGIINSVAGGGSFLTFPALLFIGIPPIQSNATSTAAVWPGTVASLFAYRKSFTPEARRLLPPLLITGIVGGVLGARILLYTPQATFLKLVPWLLLCATLLFVASGGITRWVRSRTSHHVSGDRWLTYGGLFLELFIAIYVGYFGAGVGILVLALLALLGMENIHEMNGMKTLLVSVVNGVALAIFVWSKVIVWPQALLMLVGASIGGYGGAYIAQKIDPKYVRSLVIFVGFAMSAYFFIRQWS
jgi:uncharacterized membrane protein YfcA